MKTGVVVCSRLDSTRIPGKVFQTLNGIPILAHLLRRLLKTSMEVVLAVPHSEFNEYIKFIKDHGFFDSVFILSGDDKDPLARVLRAARQFNFDHVVRITHDKIFVDTNAIRRAQQLIDLVPQTDYLYSTKLTPGTGFEFISRHCLEKASEKYKNVEHITYAAREVSEHTVCADLDADSTKFNLLIDFPEDIKLMEVLFAALGDDCTLEEVLTYLRAHPKLAYINSPPVVTVYTCVYNGAKFIGECMASVANQVGGKQFEYIIVDDCSSDNTLQQVAKFAVGKPNVKWIRNQKNMGLASSSNLALARARGRYIIRIDADDYFTDVRAIEKLVQTAKIDKAEIVYPDNYFGDRSKIQKGKEKNHIGAALFDRNALNFIRFTEGLRHHDSLDVFLRAQGKLKISYLDQPVFVYTQREGSLSHSQPTDRERLEREIRLKNQDGIFHA